MHSALISGSSRVTDQLLVSLKSEDGSNQCMFNSNELQADEQNTLAKPSYFYYYNICSFLQKFLAAVPPR